MTERDLLQQPTMTTLTPLQITDLILTNQAQQFTVSKKKQVKHKLNNKSLHTKKKNCVKHQTKDSNELKLDNQYTHNDVKQQILQKFMCVEPKIQKKLENISNKLSNNNKSFTTKRNLSFQKDNKNLSQQQVVKNEYQKPFRSARITGSMLVQQKVQKQISLQQIVPSKFDTEHDIIFQIDEETQTHIVNYSLLREKQQMEFDLQSQILEQDKQQCQILLKRVQQMGQTRQDLIFSLQSMTTDLTKTQTEFNELEFSKLVLDDYQKANTLLSSIIQEKKSLINDQSEQGYRAKLENNYEKITIQQQLKHILLNSISYCNRIREEQNVNYEYVLQNYAMLERIK
ncbi:hypothetical protein SS50377_22308 [Spironucleus salmonicida]|uniref:Uncharacterized protein n=1 Tax=Spironucleus salmonicida TaxID=348837 RepID=V6LCJ7_9EUKA|nr:hypothetical protein SS50377_22308 [Spironucleus salmonicida]|eukprot:EST42200.1 Hypothetical protein SS50377_18502 [Spironucleus salmonicida]